MYILELQGTTIDACTMMYEIYRILTITQGQTNEN